MRRRGGHWEGCGPPGFETPVLLGGAFSADHDQVENQIRRLVVLIDQFKFTRFNFGDVQNVVDQGKKGLARSLDVRGVAEDLV